MRRSKAPLPLMELMVMILVFALATVLCLQAFLKSDRLSRKGENRDRAVALCQSAAEAVRASGGDMALTSSLLDAAYPYGWNQMPLEIGYDESWEKAEQGEAVYRLLVMPVDSGVSGLGKAHISVTEDSSDEILFELDAAWQMEVTGHD